MRREGDDPEASRLVSQTLRAASHVPHPSPEQVRRAREQFLEFVAAVRHVA